MTLAPRVQPSATAPAAAPARAAPAGGRGAQPGTAAPQQRFETLTVQTQAAAAAGVDTADNGAAGARLLLPPGFSTEGPTEAVAINGNMASLDRGMMNERLEAIGRGEFNPVTGEFGQGFGPGGRGFDGGGQGFGGPGGRGGPGAGGPGGRG